MLICIYPNGFVHLKKNISIRNEIPRQNLTDILSSDVKFFRTLFEYIGSCSLMIDISQKQFTKWQRALDTKFNFNVSMITCVLVTEIFKRCDWWSVSELEPDRQTGTGPVPVCRFTGSPVRSGLKFQPARFAPVFHRFKLSNSLEFFRYFLP